MQRLERSMPCSSQAWQQSLQQGDTEAASHSFWRGPRSRDHGTLFNVRPELARPAKNGSPPLTQKWAQGLFSGFRGPPKWPRLAFWSPKKNCPSQKLDPTEFPRICSNLRAANGSLRSLGQRSHSLLLGEQYWLYYFSMIKVTP